MPSSFAKGIQKARRMAKRNRTLIACAKCKAAKSKCSDSRPCKNCTDSGSVCREAMASLENGEHCRSWDSELFPEHATSHQPKFFKSQFVAGLEINPFPASLLNYKGPTLSCKTVCTPALSDMACDRRASLPLNLDICQNLPSISHFLRPSLGINPPPICQLLGPGFPNSPFYQLPPIPPNELLPGPSPLLFKTAAPPFPTTSPLPAAALQLLLALASPSNLHPS